MRRREFIAGPMLAPTSRGAFDAGIDDVIIIPLALIAAAAKQFFHLTLSPLVHILDYAFPILLQLMRFPLFTIRIAGDGVAKLLEMVVICLPVSSSKREEWREFVSGHWSWLRRKISYSVVEEAVHHAFETGMAWVFRKCRTLTPRRALLVIAGTVLWLPVSFGIATAMHVVLIAKAASLPAWMQLLHGLAAVIGKSKLLALPVYPAAWPQAKRHPFVQAIFRLYRRFTRLHEVQKLGFRYRQTEYARAVAVRISLRAAADVGLSGLVTAMLAGFNKWASWIGRALSEVMRRAVKGLAGVPLIGAVVRGYVAHYEGVDQPHVEKASERVSGFFGRWSIKFSAEYYEAKERNAAASQLADRPNP